MSMNEEAAWRVARNMSESAETMRRAAESMDESVRRLELLLGDGYGGNGVRLLEALETAELANTTPGKSDTGSHG